MADGHIKHGTGFCIEGAEGGLVHIVYCRDKDSQLWEMLDVDRRSTSIGTPMRNRATGLCLDVGPQEMVVTAPCKPACGQRWRVSVTYDLPPPVDEIIPAPRTPVEKDRLLCWILANSHSKSSKAIAINNTWGRECDILLFISTDPFPGLDVALLDDVTSSEGRKIMWMKTQQAWMYVYMHYLDKADWFLKADENSCK